MALLRFARGKFEIQPGSLTACAQYGLVASVYVCLYVGTNFVTAARSFEHSSITLWSPDNGLSLLLLIESISFAPVVLLASIIVDLTVGAVSYNFVTIVGSEFILTLGYLFISIVLRNFFNFEKWARSYSNTVAVLAVIPASAAMTGLSYCGFLYLCGALQVRELYPAIANFWIGDTVGMIVILPAATAFHDLVLHRRWMHIATMSAAFTTLFVFALIVFFLIASVENPMNQYLFNIIYLPMIWLGINYGFNAVSFMLLFTQLLLFSTLAHYQIDNHGFTTFQTLMFIMASTGQLLGAVMTEREQTSRLLRRQQSELARVSAQATTSSLAVTMAHEISQPLSSLTNYVHSARRMVDGAQPMQAIRAALLKAEAEAGRTRLIIERIRDFVSTGRLELEMSDLAAITRKIVSLNVDEANARNVDLTAEGIDEATTIPIDRIAVEQALNNLVVNAIDAVSMSRGSRGHVKVRISRREGHAVLDVDDDGPGVAPEMAERLFDVFETTKPQGMGLGLPLTRQIVEKHSGRLTWRSLHPQGASFTMELPLHANHDEADQALGAHSR